MEQIGCLFLEAPSIITWDSLCEIGSFPVGNMIQRISTHAASFFLTCKKTGLLDLSFAFTAVLNHYLTSSCRSWIGIDVFLIFG